ncbi:glycoside hydrolase family 78 protein [Marinilongibacter aquaticus]|uniref:alpha-L-rhamnosidase n=1 Tax=Marinilongibacter aquaticus TaxID=2975157 RepID=UPI0021BD45B8|nr:alpha-L-rhamnosidase [Marinilongibacter aquaticus]UBM59927.1 glycoside hydrolase family 78 protein [Marinilongibacter aquaticus]
MIKQIQKLLLIFCLLFAQSVFAQFELHELKTNHLEKPLGIDFAQPQFSWQMWASAEQQSIRQTAYRIVVENEKGTKVWDSQKVDSGLSHAIEYAGVPLEAENRYIWKLQVWDNKQNSQKAESWFETGLMQSDISAWDGAKWIGGGDQDLVFSSHYLSVYKFGFTMQLAATNKSTKAAFLFGANDKRLMNKDLNIMGVQSKKDESYIAVELDISGLANTGEALLNIYRVGYSKSDLSEKPFKSLAIPHNILNVENAYAPHSIMLTCNFGLFEFYIDGTDEAHKIQDESMVPNSRFAPKGLNLNPVGSGNNFISFPMLADVGFRTGEGQRALFSNIWVRNFRAPSNLLFSDSSGEFFSELAVERGAYGVKENSLILKDPSQNAEPMLRRTFSTEKKRIKKARIYATARGIYSFYLNGKPLGETLFAPGLTQYNEHQVYQTYDVTDLLLEGKENAMGAWLSEGWWSGNITYSGENWNYFGDRQSLLAKLVIEYEDGEKATIVSDEKWKLFTDGPIRYGSFFQGEIYDANKEAAIAGWAASGFKAKDWKSAEEVGLRETIYPELDFSDLKILGALGSDVQFVDTLQAIGMEEVRPGVYVYDMGQNMVGFPRIELVDGPKGSLLNLRYAEVKYPDLPEYKDNVGMIMLENIRAALAQDQYVRKGGIEFVQPRFTFHGYRYLEITGIEKALPLEAVQGLAISSVKSLSSNYETDNALLNKLWKNITWSLKDNFVSIPTDCPQRNERMGWSGDISVFARSATYLCDANLFLAKHMMAMRDIQAESGRFTDVAPVGGGFGGTLWGSAGITVAWENYRQYGDLQQLRVHYPAMKRYLSFLETKLNEDGILNEGPLGDWLSPEGNRNDNTLFWMAYYAYDLDIVSEMARALGKTDEALELKEKSRIIKNTFNRVYVDIETHKTRESGVKTGFMGPPNESEKPKNEKKVIDTQASYAIPLALGTFNAENKPYAVKLLKMAIERENTDDLGKLRPRNSLMTGFIGTASLGEALSENGLDEQMYNVLLNTQYPSWLYSVVNGATTIWERLNSYTVEDGFGGNNSMNSFNHYSFGAVAAWMLNYSLGIQRDPDQVAFKHFILAPSPDPTHNLKRANGHYDSPYGRIESAWQYDEKSGYEYKFSIPANTEASLILPVKAGAKVEINGVRFDKLQVSGGKGTAELGSGKYTIKVSE